MNSLFRLGCVCVITTCAITSSDAYGATFTATNEAELAQAILDANATSGEDTIVIDTPDGVNTTISLTAPLPEIRGDLTIAGEGEGAVRISGDGLFRVFFVWSGDVTFRNMTIGDGVSIGFNGGDSLSAGGGGSPGFGGGIYVRSGRTFLERVTVDNCHVVGGNGGSIVAGGDGGGGGAGFDGPGATSVGNVGGDGGESGVFNGTAGTGGLESDGTNNPNGTAGGTGAGGGGGGGAIDPNIGGAGARGGFLGGGGGGGAGSATRRSGNGGNGGFGAGGGGAGINTGGGSGSAGSSSGGGGIGGRSLNGTGNGGGGGAGLGGALFVDTNATAVTTNVMFSNNSATGGMGGVGGDAGETDDEGADGLGRGGAIYIIAGSILAHDGLLLFDNNSASDAGSNPNFVGRVVPLHPEGGSGGGGGCFIATAAYGTPLANDVEVLRAFRDEFLLDNAFGLAFADAYYRLSPGVADGVATHPMLAAFVRLSLVPIIGLAGLLLSPTAPAAVAALAMAVVAGVLRRKKSYWSLTR